MKLFFRRILFALTHPGWHRLDRHKPNYHQSCDVTCIRYVYGDYGEIENLKKIEMTGQALQSRSSDHLPVPEHGSGSTAVSNAPHILIKENTLCLCRK